MLSLFVNSSTTLKKKKEKKKENRHIRIEHQIFSKSFGRKIRHS